MCWLFPPLYKEGFIIEILNCRYSQCITRFRTHGISSILFSYLRFGWGCDLQQNPQDIKSPENDWYVWSRMMMQSLEFWTFIRIRWIFVNPRRIQKDISSDLWLNRVVYTLAKLKTTDRSPNQFGVSLKENNAALSISASFTYRSFYLHLTRDTHNIVLSCFA